MHRGRMSSVRQAVILGMGQHDPRPAEVLRSGAYNRGLQCRVLQPTKNPFIDTIKAVLNDVKWFLFLLLVTMFG